MIEYIIGLFAGLTIYQEINFFLIKRRIKGPVKIMKGGNPFFIKRKGKKAALLIHGFTSTPQELKDLGRYLARHSITVYAPLLPGHGTSPERLSITKYYSWIEAVEESVKLLAESYDEIYLIGNSLGGNLALISANKSKKIKGIVTLGAPIFFRKEKLNKFLVLPLLKRIKLFQKKRYSKDIAKITDKKVHYDSIPLRSLKHVSKIVKLSKQNLENIKKPIQVMDVDNDTVISNESGNYILEHVNSLDRKLIRIPESYHVFIIGKYKKKAFDDIIRFIKRKK